jgi:predicted HicB family RNase H-like nuclease
MEKKRRKQMAFDISPEVHQTVKILAARRNISINLWMARAIQERIDRETKYDNNFKSSSYDVHKL